MINQGIKVEGSKEEPIKEESLNKSRVDFDKRDWQLNKKKLLERSQFALENASLSDCSFLVGKDPNTKAFNTHKMVLAWASPVFQAMFYGGIAEKDDPIVVPDVSPEAFKAMLEYIYTDSINLKSFDLGCDLLYAAKKYILPYVVEECKTYLCNNLTHENVCRVYEFAKLLGEIDIIDKCLKIMREKTDKIIKDSSFEEIDQSTLIKLLEQNFLMVSSELELIEASVHWAKKEAEQRDLNPEGGHVLREILGPAFQLLRFLTLVPSQFASGPALSSLLTREESFAILVNLNSPGSIEIPEGVCTSTELRSCPQNDGFVWDAERHTTCLCQRKLFMENSGIIESILNFSVNKTIRILGIQIASQICNSDVINNLEEVKMYDELVIVSLMGMSKNLLAYVHFEKVSKFNTLLDIKFENSVEVKQQEQHTLRVWLHKQGLYPNTSLAKSASCSDVEFTFKDAESDVVDAILFTPSSASDVKTFKFYSPTSQGPPSQRKFNFVPRNRAPALNITSSVFPQHL